MIAKLCLFTRLFIITFFASLATILNGELLAADEIRVFLGYDKRIPIGAYVFEYSVNAHSSDLVAYQLLDEDLLKSKSLLPPKWDEKQLTAFGRSRFLAPYLSNYEGWSLFVDGADMLMREDIAKLWALRDEKYSVMVVKHPDFFQEHSFLKRTITPYKMFNWSSVILFNNEKCKNLTPEYVYNSPYLDLHQFKWVESEEDIGELPKKWNYLVGYYPYSKDAALIHWTLGAPFIEGKYKGMDYADEWYKASSEMTGIAKNTIMKMYSKPRK